MRGVVFTGRKRVELRHFDDPVPGPGEVVVAIRASGLCGTDLHSFRREADIANPVIAGHEPAGDVVAVGPGVVNPIAVVGARVMVHHYQGCGACTDCNTGWPQMCGEVPIKVFGQNSNGAHADYIKVPETSLIALSDGLSYAAGAAIGCGTGTAWGAISRLGLSGRDTIAIFGQGPVGLSATLLASVFGARVIAIDLAADRLHMARSFGADETINPKDGDVAEVVRALTGGRGVSLAMETSGSNAAAAAALACLGRWGKLALVGLGTKLEVELNRVIQRQVTILSSVSMSWTGQKECADFVLERGLDLDRLFSHHFTLDQCVEAYDVFDRQIGGKAVFHN